MFLLKVYSYTLFDLLLLNYLLNFLTSKQATASDASDRKRSQATQATQAYRKSCQGLPEQRTPSSSDASATKKHFCQQQREMSVH